jgi:hypothetical protein
MKDVMMIPRAIETLIAEGMSPGTLLTHARLDSLLGLDREDRLYSLRKANRMAELKECLLLEYKVDLKNVWGQGYIVVAPEHQTAIAMDDTIRVISITLDKGAKRVLNVDIQSLSDVARTENANAIARLSGIGSMTKRQILG